jgi:acetyltransferase-like isoleucine patch superfamily enzyme
MKKLRSVFLRLFDVIILVWKGGVYYARYKGVRVGEGCRVYTTKFGTEPFLISIGNNVTITQGVVFLTHDGSTWLFRDEKGRRFLYNSIEIGSNVFIGVNSIVMPGVIIGDNVIVGAGSVITKSIPSDKIVAGNPARIIGEFNLYKSKALTEYFSERDVDKLVPYESRIKKLLTRIPKKMMDQP